MYDANLKKTESTYDALGRLTAVWLPNRNKAAGYGANSTFAYRISSAEPSWVSTSALKRDGETYNTTYEFYDSMMRPLQTQSPTPLGGRVLTDTRYDTPGPGLRDVRGHLRQRLHTERHLHARGVRRGTQADRDGLRRRRAADHQHPVRVRREEVVDHHQLHR